ncbi:hypothetical protein O7598_26355 [Micromonospora sp. WMMC241]|uniref:hypothetical protein n=1 Tax=Micromonospora sp. WMMC241 TaxID=3015159 RepID=UPI0022B60AED|nr:hypothetical protein [Micromonospora sp. WMMC241]MCZ7439950.1 hypothetical protein [Micromonospora sp. WMMC241]
MREDGGVSDEVDERVTPPLVDEAVKKAAVCWVGVDDGPAYALWCLPLDGALLVVTGPGEQAAPGLADSDAAEVTLRGDHGGRIVTWPARVTRLRPGTDEWDAAAPLVAAKRLNASGSATDLVARWAAEGCAVNRLTPAGTAVTGADLPAGPLTEQPRPAPAVRVVRRPFRLHRVRRR